MLRKLYSNTLNLCAVEIFTSLETRTQGLSMSLKQQGPLLPDEKYKSYDVKTLFTDVQVHETIDYILQEICVKEKLPKIYSKLIMKHLLPKLTTEKTLLLNSIFCK